MANIYTVGKLKKDICVSVPGSKSITNRALLLAALSSGKTLVRGISLSEDSKHFIDCLEKLGIGVSACGDSDLVVYGCGGIIPVKHTEIYVGSAGTAARFLTAMLAFSDGEYRINSSEQMSKRPMKELIEALIFLGADFTFEKERYHFPFTVKGIGKTNNFPHAVDINIDKSSQYLSALLMAAPMLDGNLTIKLTGLRSARSYVSITMNMMKDFGINVFTPDDKTYIVEDPGRCYIDIDEYRIEPDMSAACYFFAMAAATGHRSLVYNTHKNSMQGDVKFLDVLEKMGCEISDTDKGITVKGPEKLKGIDIDMSDFSDQVLTLSAIAPFADDKVCIRNVSHIRNQESDRLYVAHCELARMGIRAEITDSGIIIYPGKIHSADINTYDDHRVAMSFAITGAASEEKIRIINPDCCKKTFPDYFAILDNIMED